MLIGMIGSWWKWRRHEVGRVSVMPARSIWIGALVLLVVAAVSMWALMALYGGGSPQDKVRLEIVKLAGGIVVGTGGAAALLLAARRQRATELQLAQNERDLAQKERAADDARHDAAERRITELYSSAAEQLGSDKAPVRLAALHALERLGQNNPGHRQTVVDLLCAYLRMPFASPDATDMELRAERYQELQVRLTAQRLLTAHLRPGADEEEKFWGDMDLDLTRAELVEWDIAGCRVRNALFDGTVFSGEATFQQVVFRGAVSFREARFRGVLFGGAQFHDAARFDEAVFRGAASFRSVEFGTAASFDGTDFHGPASFAEGRFSGTGTFRQAVFRDTVSFREVEFHAAVSFNATEFRFEASFAGAHFQDSASFGESRFQGIVSFREAEFQDAAWFDNAALGEPDFAEARIFAPGWVADQGWLRGLPAWQLTTTDGEEPDEQQRRWHRFVPAEPATD
ncbi:Pentapeptide repeat-containing protein [Saccharopolyspora kobensis]|uniref:Pentapeptide repeat-containing protein n=1 Tax=Saccharopolyspora kobensis TaxID=146035 RepID=A0A1H6C6S7_9PSEU|nr:pentapeptide repeat-containing protein [Saccharopolyspora kobensis]SEG68613.1 Pentapeptide repeat-containing protein [Saccharopolyspora kobensis]SFC30510.1 Pentapeptide repeat-containing protein [Saccharopolyspora kobensis]